MSDSDVIALRRQLAEAKARIAQLEAQIDAISDRNYDAAAKRAIALTTPVWMDNEDDDGTNAV